MLQKLPSSPYSFSPSFPRLTPKLAVLIGLWAIFVLWDGHGIFVSLTTVASAWMMRQITIMLALGVWAMAAAIAFAFVLVNPLAWRNGKRLIFGSMTLALMLGRLIAGSAGYLAYVLPPSAAIPTPLIFAAAPFLLLFAGAIVIAVISAVAAGVFAFFVGIPVMIFNQIFAFEKGLAVWRYQSNSLAGYIARFVFWLRNEPLPASPPDESKGARFATREEMQAAHSAALERPARMAFGHWRDDNKSPFFVHTEKHVLIMASTRSGKGVTLIVPHLLRYPGSTFVLDPKGENAKATGRQRATFGKVYYLDPFGITGKPRSRFNPLSRLTPENMEAEGKALAAALFLVTDKERDHWNAAGQQLLAALILYVFCSSRFEKGDKDLAAVRRVLLTEMDPEHRPALKDMVMLDDGDGLLGDLARSFLSTPEKEFGSIVSTAQRQTEILDNPYLQACLAASGPGDEVDFAAWHKGTMSVFLCLSAPKFPTFSRWLRLVLTSALDEMTDSHNPPKLPVCFMLDELATLGHMAPVENAVGLAAGYGVQLVTVFQDVAQMRDLYKGRWASFIGNAGVRALFNLDDYETAEYWSKFIGGRLVETRSRQNDIYGYNKGDNVGETMRPLMSPEQLMMDFAGGSMLVLAQGVHPIITRRVSYVEDKTLTGLWDDPRKPVPSMTPAGPRPPASPPSTPTPPAGGGPRPSSPTGPIPPTPVPSPAPAPTFSSVQLGSPFVRPLPPYPPKRGQGEAAPGQDRILTPAEMLEVATGHGRVPTPTAAGPTTSKTFPLAPRRPGRKVRQAASEPLEEEMAALLGRNGGTKWD